MTPIGLSAVVSNVVLLLVLAGAIARRSFSQLQRLVIATFAFVCAWLMAAALTALRAPDWTILMGGAVTLASIVVVIATLHVWTQLGDGAEAQPGDGDDDGGGGPRRHWPDPPQPGGGGSDPTWWPEFERRLALYVAGGDRENRPLPCRRLSRPRAPSDRGGDPRFVRIPTAPEG